MKRMPDSKPPTTRQERRAQQDEQRTTKALNAMSLKACELILVRHGQTSWNVDARLQGQQVPGPPLDPLGHRQADAVAARIQQEQIACIYSSDLLRTMQTAEIIGRATNRAVVPSAQLRERNLGVLQGLTYAEAQAQQPQGYAALTSHSPTATIPGGGESVAYLQERGAAALEGLALAHPGERVLVVSHGGFLHAAHIRATGHAPPGKNVNGALNVIKIDPAGQGSKGRCSWAVVRWGEVDHLAGVGYLGTAFGGGKSG